jgi:hypothetical protein
VVAVYCEEDILGGEYKLSTTFLHIPRVSERCRWRRIIEAAHMNNGDVINDDVILSLEMGGT